MHVQGNCILETNLYHFLFMCTVARIIPIMFLKSRTVYQTVKNILVVSVPKFLILCSCSILSELQLRSRSYGHLLLLLLFVTLP